MKKQIKLSTIVGVGIKVFIGVAIITVVFTPSLQWLALLVGSIMLWGAGSLITLYEEDAETENTDER